MVVSVFGRVEPAKLLAVMKYRDIIRLLERDGWIHVRTVGSHLQFRHQGKTGTVTVSAGGKLSKDVPVGTLQSIRRQAGL